MRCQIIANNGSYELATPYDGGFLAELKNLIPFDQRVYNRDRKTWTVDRKHGQLILRLCRKYFDETPALPPLAAASTTVGILKIIYLGRSKQRTDGSKSAFGWIETKGWSAVFPESTLRNFFEPSAEGETAKAPSGNYFEMLGIKVGSTEQEIKTGYRRMVKQWHPDVCKDPDAHEIFIGIQKAYEVLSNPKLKARYEAGLKFESMVPAKARKLDPAEEYRAPLKCGNLLCEYTQLGSRYMVSKIFQWEDIINSAGQTLVSSWSAGAEEPTLYWF